MLLFCQYAIFCHRTLSAIFPLRSMCDLRGHIISEGYGEYCGF